MTGPGERCAEPAEPGSDGSSSPWRVGVLVFLCGVVALHLAVVTLAAIPPNRVSEAALPSSGYLQPYFTQNWRLFAPNPVAEDRSVRLQVAYRDAAGEIRQTDWIDWTAVELDLVRHRLVGGRAGYVTTKSVDATSRVYRALTTPQRVVVDTSPAEAPTSWTGLRDELSAAGAERSRIDAFLTYERAMARLATDVAAARDADLDVVAVRYAVVRHRVTPYAARSGSATEREAARPAPSERRSGWRPPTAGTADERRAVAAFDRSHR